MTSHFAATASTVLAHNTKDTNMTDKAKKAQQARDNVIKADLAAARAAGTRLSKAHHEGKRTVGTGDARLGAGVMIRKAPPRSSGGSTHTG